MLRFYSARTHRECVGFFDADRGYDESVFNSPAGICVGISVL